MNAESIFQPNTFVRNVINEKSILNKQREVRGETARKLFVKLFGIPSKIEINHRVSK